MRYGGQACLNYLAMSGSYGPNNLNYPKQMLGSVDGPSRDRGAKPAWGGDSQEPARAASEDCLQRAVPRGAVKPTPWEANDL